MQGTGKLEMEQRASPSAFPVAAGILPAVEPGVPPGGPSPTSKARNHSPSGYHPLGKQVILALENFRIPSVPRGGRHPACRGAGRPARRS